MWYGSAWRFQSSLRLALRSRKTNVEIGSKIDVQTVLKLMAEAITATSASFGPSAGTGTSSRCSDFVGFFSAEGSPSNIFSSSRWVVTARIVFGSSRPSTASAEARASAASTIAFIADDMGLLLGSERGRVPLRSVAHHPEIP